MKHSCHHYLWPYGLRFDYFEADLTSFDGDHLDYLIISVYRFYEAYYPAITIEPTALILTQALKIQFDYPPKERRQEAKAPAIPDCDLLSS